MIDKMLQNENFKKFKKFSKRDIVPRFLEELESLAENADIEKKYIKAAHDEYGNAVRDNSRASLIEIGKKLIG